MRDTPVAGLALPAVFRQQGGMLKRPWNFYEQFRVTKRWAKQMFIKAVIRLNSMTSQIYETYDAVNVIIWRNGS